MEPKNERRNCEQDCVPFVVQKQRICGLEKTMKRTWLIIVLMLGASIGGPSYTYIKLNTDLRAELREEQTQNSRQQVEIDTIKEQHVQLLAVVRENHKETQEISKELNTLTGQLKVIVKELQ